MPNGEDEAGLKENGWRQGSTLPSELATRLRADGHLPDGGSADLFVVASHDCDITSASFELESRAEVLLCRPLDSGLDGNYVLGKNPRVLHFTVSIEGERKNYVTTAMDRVSIDRRLVVESEPDASVDVDKQTVRVIRNWCADRYSREAFPDEFNRRLRAVSDRIVDGLKRGGIHLNAVYLLVQDEELPAEEDYGIDIVGAMMAEGYEVAEKREAAQAAIDLMEAILASAAGVRVERAVVASERNISLADIRVLKRWDYDALSLRDDPPQGVPPGR